MFARRPIGLSPHHGLVPDYVCHRVAAAHVGGLARGGVHVTSVYLHCGEGLTSRNVLLLEHVAAIIKTLRGPWVLAGDFNVTPETLKDAGYLDMINAQVVAPSDPTCNKFVCDFFVIPRILSFAVVGVQVIRNDWVRPHWPVRLLLAANMRRLAVRTIVRP